MQCSCSEWVVPGISLAKGRIDEARKADHGIRRPPGVSGPPPLAGTHSRENL
jgi:dual specificity phosphatase 12